MNNIGNQIYTGAAEYGKVMAIIKAAIAIVIGTIFIAVGIFLAVRKTNRTSFVSGTIINIPTCVENGTNKSINWNCNIIIQYVINGKTYKTPLNTNGNIHYLTGQTVDLYYDPNNITDIDMGTDNTHVIGYFIIVIAAITMIISIIWAYLATRYKSIAAVEGAYDAIDMVGGAMRNGFY